MRPIHPRPVTPHVRPGRRAGYIDLMTQLIQMETRRRLVVVATAAFLLATVIVLGTTIQGYVEVNMQGRTEVRFWRLLPWAAVWWYAWVPLSVASFELAWRFPLTRDRWLSRLSILVVGCAVAFAVDVAIQVAAMFLPRWANQHETIQEAVWYHVVISLYLNVFIYWAVVGVAHVVRAYLRSQQRALRAARLETELARARLDTLRMQLHPHFLFNTLHGVSSLIHSDQEAADAMLSRLASLLRRALDRSESDRVTLGEELDFLSEYLAVEQIRFGDRLQVSLDVPPELRNVLVPTFVLQPVVENSIKHGIVPNGNRGRIYVRARANHQVSLEVTDDGPGIDNHRELASTGVGLANLLDRLDALYGKDGKVEFLPASPSGLTVRISFPVERNTA